jgi:Domain of unknown function (DUF4249)
MKKIQYFIAFWVVTVLSNCQYPVDNSTLPEAKQFLIIDAELTPAYGKVNVSYSLQSVSSLGAYLFPKAPKAVAYVVDNRGVRFNFTLTDGTPNTAFNGVIGSTYTLYVEVDGKKYESKPETMAACPDIDSLTTPYRREVFRAPTDLFYDGFDVYANIKDVPNVENYYQWDWVHYENADYCDKRETKFDGKEVLIPCFPNRCWNIVYNTQTVVASDKLRDGQPLANRVVRVPFSTPPNKYYLKVSQRAITPSVFSYLQSIQTQTQSTGTLFDIPAQTRFNPNVFNVLDPKEQILGVFSVFSFKSKIIYIDMLQNIPNAQSKVFQNNVPFSGDIFLSAPCVEGLYRTKIKPEGWVD